jgi:hypothetical protein
MVRMRVPKQVEACGSKTRMAKRDALNLFRFQRKRRRVISPQRGRIPPRATSGSPATK